MADKGLKFRINQQIDVREVMLVTDQGENLGVVPIDKALNIAAEKGLDLVELSPNAKPPVCKVIDYGKYKYQAQKKAHEAKKKQKTIDVKEIKLRPNIGENDLNIKVKKITKFLKDGNRVKVSVRFRGREIHYKEYARNLLIGISDHVEAISKIEFAPKVEGRLMLMILAPL
jgi:translation initiation factor IF-3